MILASLITHLAIQRFIRIDHVQPALPAWIDRRKIDRDERHQMLALSRHWLGKDLLVGRIDAQKRLRVADVLDHGAAYSLGRMVVTTQLASFSSLCQCQSSVLMSSGPIMG
ncbi:hypothetical protein INR99_12035 [Chitinilyticum litopenaei]|uniref:Uncharacterized protein n=1 Tax=Chitinilyticum piscinae TaxID=2866724 RepID=A0A8J7G162_9NEIS|nr:hypothetical protein [Chitinilyticum piscinae]